MGNFQGTYECSGNPWEFRSCRQKQGESLHEYIQHFSKQCNVLPDVVVGGPSLIEFIRKRMDTDVSFTLEYSRVSNPPEMRSVLSSESCLSRGYDGSEEIQLR